MARLLMMMIVQLSGWIVNSALIASVIYCAYSLLLLGGVVSGIIPFNEFIWIVAILGCVMSILEIIVANQSSHEKLMKGGFQCHVADVTGNSGFPEVVNAWSKEMKVDSPKIFLFMSDGIFGFASGKSETGAINISKGLFNSLNSIEKMRWFVLMQFYHLQYGLGYSTRFWLNIHLIRSRYSYLFESNLNKVLGSVGSAFGITWLTMFIFKIILFWKWFFSIGTKASTKLFKAFDLFLGWRGVIKGDDYACSIAGKEAGVNLIQSIGKSPEPNWAEFFSAYPKYNYRIKRMINKI